MGTTTRITPWSQNHTSQRGEAQGTIRLARFVKRAANADGDELGVAEADAGEECVGVCYVEATSGELVDFVADGAAHLTIADTSANAGTRLKSDADGKGTAAGDGDDYYAVLQQDVSGNSGGSFIARVIVDSGQNNPGA